MFGLFTQLEPFDFQQSWACSGLDTNFRTNGVSVFSHQLLFLSSPPISPILLAWILFFLF
jgi:hypothetical protein